MDYKRYRFRTSSWVKEFKRWFPSIHPISHLYFQKLPEKLVAQKGYFYILQDNALEYLLGYAMESGEIRPYQLYPWTDESVLTTLYGEFKTVNFTRCDLITRVWRRFEKLEGRKPYIFIEGEEDMKKAYRRWEEDRYAMWICFKHMKIDMSVLVQREVFFFKMLGTDFLQETCIKLKLIPPTLETFHAYLSKQYAVEVRINEDAFAGIVEFLQESVRQKWTDV